MFSKLHQTVITYTLYIYILQTTQLSHNKIDFPQKVLYTPHILPDTRTYVKENSQRIDFSQISIMVTLG